MTTHALHMQSGDKKVLFAAFAGLAAVGGYLLYKRMKASAAAAPAGASLPLFPSLSTSEQAATKKAAAMPMATGPTATKAPPPAVSTILSSAPAPAAAPAPSLASTATAQSVMPLVNAALQQSMALNQAVAQATAAPRPTVTVAPPAQGLAGKMTVVAPSGLLVHTQPTKASPSSAGPKKGESVNVLKIENGWALLGAPYNGWACYSCPEGGPGGPWLQIEL